MIYMAFADGFFLRDLLFLLVMSVIFIHYIFFINIIKLYKLPTIFHHFPMKMTIFCCSMPDLLTLSLYWIIVCTYKY